MDPSEPPNKPDIDFQQYRLELAGREALTHPVRAVNCTVKGTVFSIAPAKSSNSSLWVITSLNAQGWEHRGESVDVRSEWMRFANDVLALQRLGCFPNDESPQEVLRQISETIPLPASEELLYSYSLGGSGFLDLVPGMQLVIERASFQTKTGTRVLASNIDDFSERLMVVGRSPSGTALRLLGIVSHGLGKTLDNGADSPRLVPDHFAASSELRLMLLDLTNGNTRRFPVLLGSTDTFELWNASDRIVGGTLTGCPPPSSPGLECMFFDKDSTVSVLMSVWVNGRHLYRPPSATVWSLIGMLPDGERDRALATVSIERPLIGGGYARVDFPHDREGAGRVLLLNGDHLTWHS